MPTSSVTSHRSDKGPSRGEGLPPLCAPHEQGFTLIELLVAVALLAAVAVPFYALVVGADRGWSLLQGQLDAQQNPRAALERLINDLRQATDFSITGGTQLSIQKATILVCPAPAGATQVLVENASDIQVGSTITLTALSAQETGKTVTAIGAVTTCSANGATGTPLAVSPPVASTLFPYGTFASPIPVTYSLNAQSQALRAGVILADNATALSFTQQATTLAAAALAGSTSISVANTVPSTSDFGVGNLIYIESEIRAVTALSVGVSTTTVTLDQALFFPHIPGAAVRRKLATAQITVQVAQPAAGGGQVQKVLLPSEGAPRDPPLE